MPQSDPDKILAFKLGGIGDVVDYSILLGGIRAKHPDAVLTAIVRDKSHVPFLRAVHRKDTGQCVVDIALPVARQTLRYKHCWKCRILVYDNDEYTGKCHVCGRRLWDYWHTRSQPLDWIGALKHELHDSDYDYVYEWRPYVGWVTSYHEDAEPKRQVVYIPKAELGDHWKAFSRFLSRDTNRLAQLNKTTVELGSLSMQVPCDWDDVELRLPDIPKGLDLASDYVVMTNACDGRGKQTKQWSYSRMGEVAAWLRGKGYQPVQLGIKRDKPILNCRDLRGKTSILEAAAVIKRAKLLVGIEGGLARIAGLVGTPSVVIFLSTPQELFRVPQSYPVHAGMCPLKHGCFWWTAEWAKTCVKQSLIQIESSEVLPRCAAFTRTDHVKEAIDKALS